MIQSNLEEALTKGPDEVARALLQWRKAELDRETLEAKLMIQLRADNPDATATEIKALLHNTKERYEAKLQEITFESIYQQRYESLLAAKKEASMRTAF